MTLASLKETSDALGRARRARRRSPEALVALTRSARDADRQEAASQLGRCDFPEARDTLLHLVGEDRAPGVRAAAARALGASNCESAVIEALTVAVQDQDSRVRMTAAESLGRLRCDRAVGPLMLLIDSPVRDERVFAVQALTRIRTRACLMPLLSALEDEDGQVASNAAIGLKFIVQSRDLPLLERRLSEGSAVRRRHRRAVMRTARRRSA